MYNFNRIKVGDYMILRKPYAFLIKHFKLIHLVMCAVLVYIVYKCNDMHYYFAQYINAGYYIKIGDVVGEYINIYLYICLFIILFLDLTILILLHIKEKNNFIYTVIFVVYIVITGLVINGHINLLNMQLEVIDFRKVRLFKDMLFVSIFIQYAAIIFTLIRGLGFNVKKFNFDEELEQLNISSSDNAEFEFTVDLNTNSFARKLRSKRRHMRYFFVEHKNIFIILGIIVIIFSSFVAFVNIGTKGFSYKENVTIKINDNTIVVNGSYIVNKDYSGNIIDKNNSYLVVNFDIKNNGSESNSLDYDKFSLIIGDDIYYPIETGENNFFDFGEYYNGVKLKKDSVRNYILVFKIPNNNIDNKYTFRYSALQTKNDKTVNKDFNIKLSPISKWVEQEITTKKMGEELNLHSTILGDTKIKINNYDMEQSYDVAYRYCISNICDDLVTSIFPSDLMQDTKTILKLDLSIDYDNKITSNNIKNKSNLISKLGKIEYVLPDGKTYVETKLISLTPNEISDRDEVYLEVDYKLLSATKIMLILDIRGGIYTYILLE